MTAESSGGSEVRLSYRTDTPQGRIAQQFEDLQRENAELRAENARLREAISTAREHADFIRGLNAWAGRERP